MVNEIEGVIFHDRVALVKPSEVGVCGCFVGTVCLRSPFIPFARILVRFPFPIPRGIQFISLSLSDIGDFLIAPITRCSNTP